MVSILVYSWEKMPEARLRETLQLISIKNEFRTLDRWLGGC